MEQQYVTMSDFTSNIKKIYIYKLYMIELLFFLLRLYMYIQNTEKKYNNITFNIIKIKLGNNK